MISSLHASTYTVLVTNQEVRNFASAWPCGGLDTDVEYLFEFSASNGDIVDLAVVREGRQFQHEEGQDGPAVAALADDACRRGAEDLGLEDVIAIRYGPAQRPS